MNTAKIIALIYFIAAGYQAIFYSDKTMFAVNLIICNMWLVANHIVLNMRKLSLLKHKSEVVE